MTTMTRIHPPRLLVLVLAGCWARAAEADTYRTVQVHVVHRHGDRSPITPMKDEAFWASTLIPPATLDKIAEGTAVMRDASSLDKHTASGRGPFGKLSELGLLQMIQVGTTLREMYESSSKSKSNDNLLTSPLTPDQIQVFSTDFPRTIQSVQGLLVGLFPDGTGAEDPIPIDTTFAPYMIPDPIPRHTNEQAEWEERLAVSDRVVQREQELRPLAIRTTEALQDQLAPDAHEAVFGVIECRADNDDDDEKQQQQQPPLAWVQLAEITKCLAVRQRLPEAITAEDRRTIAEHAAWRWFATLSHPRVAYLAMHRMVQKQVDYFLETASSSSKPPMVIWSAHDSTLIGLLCAYRLQKPSTWPEYASYLLIELVEKVSTGHDDDATQPNELFVKFSINQEPLAIQWEGQERMDMIPLETLHQNLQITGEEASSSTI